MSKQKVLLLTPPMTQINTPYPATAYLSGFLRSRGYDVNQADPAIELFTRLMSKQGMCHIREILRTAQNDEALDHASVQFFLANFERYYFVIDAVMAFLQGKDPSLAMRIAGREFLPEGPRFAALADWDKINSEPVHDSLAWAFGSLGNQDRAKYLASLLIDDLADVIREGIDGKFALSKYGEKLAASVPTFQPLKKALKGERSLVDDYLIAITQELVEKHQPNVVGMTVPFPGNVYGAFRMAKTIKEISPATQIVLGGGYVNTELREISDVSVFDYVDFITLDDGEKPLLCILEHLAGKRGVNDLLRTFIKQDGKVVLKSNPKEHDIPQKDLSAPSYSGLPLEKYVSVLEMLNPMHRVWSDGRWNKLTLAHGCYWKKCNFCDVSLDYINRYEANHADRIVDRIEQVIAETGQRGFHFVDEAAPPLVLFAMAERLIERKVAISWWGNIRFEKTFTAKRAELLAKSGCVAVSGGLEVASDRLLKLMNKGVTVEQVAKVTHAFSSAGILVHAYLMYGFPTQTTQETIDALERVRQLFAEGCIQSGFWHRFAATVHSPIGKDPKRFGIITRPQKKVTFASNDLAFIDPTPCDHERLGKGLNKALYNYMLGIGLEEDVRSWFARMQVPRANVSANLIADALLH